MADEKKTSSKPEKEAKADKSKAKKKSKKNPFKSIASFFKSVKAEGKKVVWANAKDVARNTVIVLIVVFIVGICIYGVDTLLSLGMKGIKNLAEDVKATTSVSEQGEATTAAALEEATEADTEAETEATTEAAE
ncbi:MAG: preprotein translocase subunit SecE [Eubacteriales bacterium]|nr:preprotein translocase subunit SecE [Eubacteriales bacterium]